MYTYIYIHAMYMFGSSFLPKVNNALDQKKGSGRGDRGDRDGGRGGRDGRDRDGRDGGRDRGRYASRSRSRSRRWGSRRHNGTMRMVYTYYICYNIYICVYDCICNYVYTHVHAIEMIWWNDRSMWKWPDLLALAEHGWKCMEVWLKVFEHDSKWRCPETCPGTGISVALERLCEDLVAAQRSSPLWKCKTSIDM